MVSRTVVFAFVRGLLPAVALAAALAPLTALADFASNCNTGCHGTSGFSGARLNGTSRAIILGANANKGMGIGGLSTAVLDGIATEIVNNAPGTQTVAAVPYRSQNNVITVTSIFIDRISGNNTITGTGLGTLAPTQGGGVSTGAFAGTAGASVNPTIQYDHNATNCTTESFDVVGTGPSGNTIDRRISVPITPPTVTAANTTVAAIAYGTGAVSRNISGVISVSGTGSLPTGTLTLSGQSGTGTIAATGATTFTYAATGTTYTANVTVNYHANGPCATTSATRTITIPVSLPAAPTATDLGPFTAASIGTTPISVTGIAGFTAVSPLNIVSQPPAGEGTVAITGPAQFTYTGSGFVGTTTFQYSVLGPTGSGLSSITRTITISPTAAPFPGAGTATTAFNTPVTVDLTPFITGAFTSVSVSGPSSNGAAIVASANQITFTPTAGYFGPATFGYTATGPGGPSPATGTVTVTVNPPIPTVSPTTGNVAYNTATPLDVAAFISPAVTITSVNASGATNGTITGISGTVITFTPTAGYIGPASYTYTATNITGTSAPATVSLTVQPPAAPTSAGFDFMVSSTLPTQIDVSSLLTSVVSSIAITTPPTNGTANPTSATMITYSPGANFVPFDTFFYSATGPGGTSAPGRIRVFYTNAPVTPDVAFTVPFNSITDLDLLSRITGTFTGAITFPQLPTNGELIVRGSVISYRPNPNFTGSDSFTYSVTGTGGASRAGTVRITVNPPIATTTGGTASVSFNTPSQIDLSRFVNGVLSGITITVGPEHGSLTLSGSIATYTPAPGYFGPDQFTFVVRNGAGTSAPATITITVGSLKPVASAASLAVELNSSRSIDTAPLISGSGVTGVTVTRKPAHGTVEVNGTTFTYTPNHNFFGPDSFQYIAFGNLGSSSPATISITVTGRPDPRDDPDVRGLVDAQSQVPSRFTRAQVSNFQRRMETLHRGPDSAFPEKPVKPEPAAPAGEATPPAASSPPPASGPTSRAPSLDGAVASTGATIPGVTPLVSSLISLATSQSVGVNGATEIRNGLSVWIAGLATFGELDSEGGRSGSRFSTDGMSVGIDKRLSDNLVLGVGGGYARDRTGVGSNGTNNKSRGSSFAFYGSFQPSMRTYLDMMVGFGTIDMDSQRYVPEIGQFGSATRKVDQVFGSIAGGYEWRQDGVLVSPYGRLDFTQDKFKTASESGASQYNLTYNGQTQKGSAGAVGLRAESQHEMEYGRAIPHLRVEYRREFQDDRTTVLNYADLFGGTEYSVTSKGTSRNAVLLGIGSDFLVSGGLKLGFDYTVERNSGSKNVQAVRLIAVQDLDFKDLPPFRFTSSSLTRPVSIDFGASYDDNVSRGRLEDEKRSDSSFSLGIGQEYVFPIGTNFRLVATPLVTGEKFRRWAGLGRFSGGLQAETQYRSSGAFDATTFGLKGSAIYDQYESSLRTGARYFLGVNARRALTDKIDLFGEVGANRRDGKSEVFQLRDWSAKANIDYSLGRNGVVYAAGEYRKGDTFASGLGSLANAAIADVFVIDDAFENQLVAYRLDARTVLGTVGYNRPLGPRDSLDFSYRRVQTDPSNKPSFDAGGPLKYIDNQYSIVYLLRF